MTTTATVMSTSRCYPQNFSESLRASIGDATRMCGVEPSLMPHLAVARIEHQRILTNNRVLRKVKGRIVGVWEPPLPTLASHTRVQYTMALLHWAIQDEVPGDVVETGVFVGGITIVMLHMLRTFDSGRHRLLWAADSFAGLPRPSAADRDAPVVIPSA